MIDLLGDDGTTIQVDCGPEWCGRCEYLDKPISKPRCKLFNVAIHAANPGDKHSYGRLRCGECRQRERAAVEAAKPTREQLEARIAELEKTLAAGDALAQAVVRCGLHTWQNIPVQSTPLAVALGCRMYEYINASPTFEWPEDEPGRFVPKTREQLKAELVKARGNFGSTRQ
ncbi:MAG TPA: hypothetical protein VL494_13375 [Steroidobacteraceae bacterium]|jgi:hypothetical protein|nr:hypothetical protein [Steroidobacteraceae bacterium]